MRTSDAIQSLENWEAEHSARMGFPARWPMETGEVVSMLRERGLTVTPLVISRAMAESAFSPVPQKIGRSYEWDREHVEALAKLLIEREALTEDAVCRLHLGISRSGYRAIRRIVADLDRREDGADLGEHANQYLDSVALETAKYEQEIEARLRGDL